MMDLNQSLDIALALCKSGLPDQSEEILRALPQTDPRVLFNLGWHDLRHGKFRKGFEGLHMGRFFNGFGSGPCPGTMWTDQPLEGKTVLLHGEGGAGDEIINFRFALELQKRGARVIVSSTQKLGSLFSDNGFIAIREEGIKHVHYDYWIPAMSAPGMLHETSGEILRAPYLKRAPLLPPSTKKRIGIRWGGQNSNKDVEPMRKVPYELIHKLIADFPQFEWYSFQRDDDLHLEFPGKDLSGHMPTWNKTAGLLASMDLLISSCTSVVHIAAAMGVKTWVLTPIMPYYTWAEPGETSPWYESVRLFRQIEQGQWERPILNVREALVSL